MVEIKESFRVRLEKALEHNNMKPVDLAKKTGISESTISQYRSGYSKPKDERLVTIANVLQVDPAWLMGVDVPMQKHSSPTPEATGTDAAPMDLTASETDLINNYRQLNEDGQDKVSEYAGDLVSSGRYKKHPDPNYLSGSEEKMA